MPRKSHRQSRTLPKYCEHKPSGQAYVRLTEDGERKTVYLGPYNSRESLDEYDRVCGDWLAKRPVGQRQDVLTVRDMAERYKSYHEDGATRRQRDCLNSATRLLTDHFGDRPAEEFDAVLFDRFKRELVKAGYARKYANELLGVTKKAFRWAAQRRMIPAENYTLIDTVEPLTPQEAPTRKVQPVDQKTVDATLPELSDELADMIRFIYPYTNHFLVQRMGSTSPREASSSR